MCIGNFHSHFKQVCEDGRNTTIKHWSEVMKILKEFGLDETPVKDLLMQDVLSAEHKLSIRIEPKSFNELTKERFCEIEIKTENFFLRLNESDKRKRFNDLRVNGKEIKILLR